MNAEHSRKSPASVDPNGVPQHTPGAKLDGGKVRLDLVLQGFPRALYEVAEVATYGAGKYTRDGWLYVPDGVNRYTGALMRHLVSEATGEKADPESELRHAAHAAWNALARLELLIRADAGDNTSTVYFTLSETPGSNQHGPVCGCGATNATGHLPRCRHRS